MAWRFERVAGPFAGPMTGLAWDGSGVLCALPEAMAICRHDPRTGATADHRRYTGHLNGIALAADGTLYGAQESGRRVIAFLPDGSATVTATRFQGAIHNFPCDVAVDRRGRVWFSDSHTGVQVFGPRIFPLLDHASVLRLERDDRRSWKLQRITFDTLAPRAVLLSQDEDTLFVAEGEVGRPGPRELRAYPVRGDGTVGAYRTLHTFGADHRGPQPGIEGLCHWGTDRILACGGGPGRGPGPVLQVYRADGRLAEVHPFDVEATPSHCAVGDGSLYVSASDGCLYRAALPPT